jgi:hypothetical protein
MDVALKKPAVALAGEVGELVAELQWLTPAESLEVRGGPEAAARIRFPARRPARRRSHGSGDRRTRGTYFRSENVTRAREVMEWDGKLVAPLQRRACFCSRLIGVRVNGRARGFPWDRRRSGCRPPQHGQPGATAGWVACEGMPRPAVRGEGRRASVRGMCGERCEALNGRCQPILAVSWSAVAGGTICASSSLSERVLSGPGTSRLIRSVDRPQFLNLGMV